MWLYRQNTVFVQKKLLLQSGALAAKKNAAIALNIPILESDITLSHTFVRGAGVATSLNKYI